MSRVVYTVCKICLENDVSFSFANYYGDHMVLQKSPSQANVWGWAKVSDIGSEVTITLSSTSNPSNAKEYKATVTAGKFTTAV